LNQPPYTPDTTPVLAKETLWQARRDGEVIFEFLNQTATRTTVSSDETRTVTVTGPDTSQVLNWAMAMPTGWTPSQTTFVSKTSTITQFETYAADGVTLLPDLELWNRTNSAAGPTSPTGFPNYGYNSDTNTQIGTGSVACIPSDGYVNVELNPGGSYLGGGTFDFSNSSFSCSVAPATLNADQADQGYTDVTNLTDFTEIIVKAGTGSGYASIALGYAQFYCQYQDVNGVVTTHVISPGRVGEDSGYNPATGTSTAYSSSTAQYWRLSCDVQSGGTLLFRWWTSPDDATWTLQWSLTEAAGLWDVTNVDVYLGGSYSTASAAYAQFTSPNGEVEVSPNMGPVYLSKPIFAVYQDLLFRAQDRGTLPFVSLSFDQLIDSGGQPWTDEWSIQVAVGSDLLSLIQNYGGAIDADWMMLPGYVLEVGNQGTLGTDYSGTIVFHEGESTQYGRTQDRSQLYNVAAAQDVDGQIHGYTNPSSITQWGQREIFVASAGTMDEASTAQTAQAAVQQYGQETDARVFQIPPAAPGKTPFTDFGIWDWVGIERGDFGAIEAQRVVGITYTIDQDGNESCELIIQTYRQVMIQYLQYLVNKLGGQAASTLGAFSLGTTGPIVGTSPVSLPSAPASSIGKATGASSAVGLTVASPLAAAVAASIQGTAPATAPAPGQPATTEVIPGSMLVSNSVPQTALSFTLATGALVTFSGTAPADPNVGDLWYDSSAGNQLYQWTGTSWQLYQFGASAIASGSLTTTQLSATAGITAGQVAFHATDIGGIQTYVQSTAPSGTIAAGSLWYDTASANEVYIYESGSWTSYAPGAGGVNFTAAQIGGVEVYVQGTAPSGTINTGSLWYNTSAGNQLYIYQSGSWTLYQFSSAAIAAGGVAASNAGFVAQSIGGTGVFVASSAPYDWSLTPSAGTTSTFTTAGSVLTSATPLALGDTFTDVTNARGGPFTVTSITPSGSNVIVGFTPTASSSISTGDTLHGNTNGNMWFNSASGYQLSTWSAGVWTAYQYGTSAIAAGAITATQIASNTITAGQILAGTITGSLIASGTIQAGNIQSGTITATQIAANTILAANLVSGIVVAGIVDATTITGASVVADGAAGQLLIYSGTPQTGNLVGSWSGQAGTDGFSNPYPAGLQVLSGAITGVDLDSTNITNSSMDSTSTLTGTAITQAPISGGSMIETEITFDSTDGWLLAYTSTTTTITESSNGNYTFTPPAGVTTCSVTCTGAGAGGGGGTTSNGGESGGGGECASNPNLPVVPLATYGYVVGNGGGGGSTGNAGGNGGDSYFNGGPYAHGGQAGYGGTGGAGGTGSSDPIHKNGGAGQNSGSGTGGAGGGGSAGTVNGGGQATVPSGSTGSAGGVAGTGGGAAGGHGGNGAANGSNGNSPGAAGGGAGAASGVVAFSQTFDATSSKSYYGSDASNGDANGTRASNSTIWQGGELATGGSANGTQKAAWLFNSSAIQAACVGVTVSQINCIMSNQHSWYGSGMTVQLRGWPASKGSSLPSTWDGTGATALTQFNVDEGERITVPLYSNTVAPVQFPNGTLIGFTIGPGPSSWDLSYYGYFNGTGSGSEALQLEVIGTTGSAPTQAGAGADGEVVITYTSGSTLVAAVSPEAFTDQYSNAIAAGMMSTAYTLIGGSAPSTPASGNAALWASSAGTASVTSDSGQTGTLDFSQTDAATHSNSNAGTQLLTKAWTIDANDASVGTVYEILVPFNAQYESETIQLRPQLNGSNTSGDSGGDITGSASWSAGAGLTGWARLFVQIITTGTGGTANFFWEAHLGLNSTRSTGTNTNFMNLSAQNTGVTFNTTVSNTISLVSIFGASAASQFVTGEGSTFTRKGP
jgi:hypothetical protein